MSNSLGYGGSKELKEDIINRMKTHVKADELVKGQGYITRGPVDGQVQGCAVACIASEDLFQTWQKAGFGTLEKIAEDITTKVDEILNIKGIGVVIDVLHEKGPYNSSTFSLNILRAIEVDVDYAGMMDEYLEPHLLREEIRVATEEGFYVPTFSKRVAVKNMLFKKPSNRDYKGHKGGDFVLFVRNFNKRWRKENNELRINNSNNAK